MKKHQKVLIPLGILILLGAVLLVALVSGLFGVTAAGIEADARKAGHIDGSWEARLAVSDRQAAVLFYPPDKTQFSYSVYYNESGLPWSFHFRQGGSTPGVMEGIEGFAYTDHGSVYVSMNVPRVARMEFEDDTGTRTVPIDPDEPFVETTGPGVGESYVCFYDENGDVVPIHTINVYG